jgi:hypothetical protein
VSALSPSWTTARARLAGLYRRGATDDDPRVVRARADLAAARLDDQIELALDDPVELAKAAKIIGTALARHRLTLAPSDDTGPEAAA